MSAKPMPIFSGLSTPLRSVSAIFVAFMFLAAAPKASARKLVNEESNEDATVSAPYKEGENGMDLRKKRRVAIGAQAAGALGMGGLMLELALTPQWSFNAGWGGGEGFQAVEFQGKYVLAGDWLMPYMAFGYARWTSSEKTGYIQKTNPPLLANKLLSNDERAAGEFAENILYPGIGLQYMQLSGPWAGSSVYAELTVLLSINNFVAAPTGSLGMLYYF